MNEVAVIGGGAAGMMAAVTAAGAGARVTLLERNEKPVSYTHLRAHETGRNLVCRLLLEKKKKKKTQR